MLPILICKNCFFHLRKIARIKEYLSTSDIQTLVHAFITSKLAKCNSLLYGLPKFLIDRLQNVQNCAARLVTGSKKYDHITPLMKQLHWLPISQRIIYKIVPITYKSLNGSAPHYMEFIYWSSVECRGLNVEGEGKKSRARVKSRG